MKEEARRTVTACRPSLHRISLTISLNVNDMAARPKPEAETSKISTCSLLLLKYWPSIKVAVSLTIPTPMPTTSPWDTMSWWKWKAKEVKRQPRAVTRPPITAVSLQV